MGSKLNFLYNIPDEITHPTFDQSLAVDYRSGRYLFATTKNIPLHEDEAVQSIQALDDDRSTEVWSFERNHTYILSYSFVDPDLGLLDQRAYGNGDAFGQSVYNGNLIGLSGGQKNAVRQALSVWESFLNIEFKEVVEEGTNVGVLRFGGTSFNPSSSYAWAYFPQQYWSTAGDIWAGNDMMSEENWSAGTYEFFVLLHEIGHALGLEHTHEGQVMPRQLDDTRYTLMSYNSASEAEIQRPGPNLHTDAFSPMVLDIEALQSAYGENPHHNSGHTDHVILGADPKIFTLYDSDGIDRISIADLSGLNVLDLGPGAYSTLQYNDWSLTDNFAIARSTWIENALGGTGNDLIIGNSLNNHIDGNVGDDKLFGGIGNDSLIGNSGRDQLEGGTGDDVLTDTEGASVIIDTLGRDYIETGAQNDHITAFEGADTIISGTGDDTIAAGNASDTIFAGDGNDIVIADHSERFGRGNDTINAGAGDDLIEGGNGSDTFIFYASDTGDNVIANIDPNGRIRGRDFDMAQDVIVLSGFDVQTFSELSSFMNGTRIDFQDLGFSLELIGVPIADLDDSNFIFW